MELLHYGPTQNPCPPSTVIAHKHPRAQSKRLVHIFPHALADVCLSCEAETAAAEKTTAKSKKNRTFLSMVIPSFVVKNLRLFASRKDLGEVECALWRVRVKLSSLQNERRHFGQVL